MDFTLALTHFCESHGPRSILCTQVLPLECSRCLPPSPTALHPQSSGESLRTHVHDSDDQSHPIPQLRRHDTSTTLPADFSRASTTVDSDPESVSIEQHAYFKALGAESSHLRSGRGHSDTCASCTFTVPAQVASKLPSDRNVSTTPVLRSREFVCLGRKRSRHEQLASTSHTSKSSGGSSLDALVSPQPDAHPHDCHDHTLTYLTSKSPESALTYATLRNSVVRTLSCELLPRGMSDGPFCFGDSTTGYTIAHSFRLSDPKARGRRRTYAFVALAGTDASRAFKACPLIWEAFAKLAKSIEAMAMRKQEDARRQQEEEESVKGKRNYTCASSFLTQRQVEPDGTPRRVGHTTPRSLSEIVGDDHIFAILHQYFVALLKCLGDRFGGLPLADNRTSYDVLAAEQAFAVRTVPSTAAAPSLKHEPVTVVDKPRGDGPTSTQRKTQQVTPPVHDDIALLKKRMSQGLSLQCAPIAHETAGPTQVVM
ncbi:hypothetical protein DV735_g5414, partial [Chaetothyriales sp. CBS 134920]